MIIFEGPDGAGKTTLISEMKEVFDLPVAGRVVSKEAKAMTDLKAWTERNVAEGFEQMIYDRHRLISEPIYGAMLRDQFEPGFDDPEWMHNMLFQLYNIVKPVIIYCIPPFPIVKRNIENDPDNIVVKNSIRSIWSLYMTKAVTDIATYDRAVFYDYTKPHTKTRAGLAIAEALKGTRYDSYARIKL